MLAGVVVVRVVMAIASLVGIAIANILAYAHEIVAVSTVAIVTTKCIAIANVITDVLGITILGDFCYHHHHRYWLLISDVSVSAIAVVDANTVVTPKTDVIASAVADTLGIVIPIAVTRLRVSSIAVAIAICTVVAISRE